MGASLLSRVKGFDAYAKTIEDFRVKTSGGGIITLLSALCIAALLISEFAIYRTVEMKPELIIDRSRKQKLAINLNITFPRMPCFLLSIDVMDVAGEHQDDLAHDVYKTRLSAEGRPILKEKEKTLGRNGEDNTKALHKSDGNCGSCYGGEEPENGCCNSCADVREAYKRRGWSFGNPEGVEQCVREGWTEKIQTQAKEGCNVHGRLELNKVAGNFHIAPGASFSQGNMHVHDFQPYMESQLDFSHEIHHFSFGERFDGVVNPLDGAIKKTDEANHMFQYFVKVVGTAIRYRTGAVLRTNQYSVTQYEKANPKAQMGRAQLPGVFLNYEISPLMVVYTEHQRSIAHFLAGVCSVIGGIFTVAGLLDSVVYKAERTLRKKIELGKAS